MSGKDSYCKKLNFDTKVYPVEAILGTAYKYLDQMYTRLEFENGGAIITANLKAKKVDDRGEWEKYVEDFEEEVLSQSLRLKILKCTKKVRDQIITIALAYSQYDTSNNASEAERDICAAQKNRGAGAGADVDKELEAILSELRSSMDNADYEEDPMDIAVPWEEKYE